MWGGFQGQEGRGTGAVRVLPSLCAALTHPHRSPALPWSRRAPGASWTTSAACSTTWRTSWMPCWSEGRDGPANLRAYVGTRAQRSTISWPRRPLPVPFVQPSPPGHPVPRGLHKEEDTSGLCSRTRRPLAAPRRLWQDSLLQKQKKKNQQPQQKKQSNTTQPQTPPSRRLWGCRGFSSTYLPGGHSPPAPRPLPLCPCPAGPGPECSTTPAR